MTRTVLQGTWLRRPTRHGVPWRLGPPAGVTMAVLPRRLERPAQCVWCESALPTASLIDTGHCFQVPVAVALWHEHCWLNLTSDRSPIHGEAMNEVGKEGSHGMQTLRRLCCHRSVLCLSSATCECLVDAMRELWQLRRSGHPCQPAPSYRLAA
jgi:hypothetical protein